MLTVLKQLLKTMPDVKKFFISSHFFASIGEMRCDRPAGNNPEVLNARVTVKASKHEEELEEVHSWTFFVLASAEEMK